MQREPQRRASTRRAVGVLALVAAAGAAVWFVAFVLGRGMDGVAGAPPVAIEPLERAEAAAPVRADALDTVHDRTLLRGKSADRRSGILRGRVTGLPVQILMRAHPVSNVVFQAAGPEGPEGPAGTRERQTVIAELDSEGRFESPALSVGSWEVRGPKDLAFRLEPQVVDVRGGEVLELTLAARVAQRRKFRVTVDQSALGTGGVVPYALWVSWAGRVGGIHSKAEVTVHADVCPGELQWVVRLGRSDGTAVFPRPEAHGTVVVQAADWTGRREAVPVKLAFKRLDASVLLTGTVMEGDRPATGGVSLTATRPAGERVEEPLRLGADGEFVVHVDVARVAGPQVTIGMQMGGRWVGPFALTGESVDVGVLRLPEQERRELKGFDFSERIIW